MNILEALIVLSFIAVIATMTITATANINEAAHPIIQRNEYLLQHLL